MKKQQKTTYVIKKTENDEWTLYRKRKLFGLKRITPGAFPTIYVAVSYLKTIDDNLDINIEYV